MSKQKHLYAITQLFSTLTTLSSSLNSESVTPENPTPPISGGLWTDDDLDDLVRLTKKYPPGVPKRWELVAQELGRSVPEVTFMANRIKTGGFRTPGEGKGGEEEEEERPKVKQKTRAKAVDEKVEEEVKKWSQQQQKALEEALARYPKGCLDRWDRIGDCVPNKTKVSGWWERAILV